MHYRQQQISNQLEGVKEAGKARMGRINKKKMLMILKEKERIVMVRIRQDINQSLKTNRMLNASVVRSTVITAPSAVLI